MVSEETPLDLSIHLAEGGLKWVWATGSDPVEELGSPWVPAARRPEARGPAGSTSQARWEQQTVLAILTKEPWMKAEQADLGAFPSQQSLFLHGNLQLQGYVGTAVPSVYP